MTTPEDIRFAGSLQQRAISVVAAARAHEQAATETASDPALATYHRNMKDLATNYADACFTQADRLLEAQ